MVHLESDGVIDCYFQVSGEPVVIKALVIKKNVAFSVGHPIADMKVAHFCFINITIHPPFHDVCLEPLCLE